MRTHQGSTSTRTTRPNTTKQKISQLRLKMFARVRRYNESTEEWQQQVIEVPTDATDYWFARIHFVGKE